MFTAPLSPVTTFLFLLYLCPCRSPLSHHSPLHWSRAARAAPLLQLPSGELAPAIGGAAADDGFGGSATFITGVDGGDDDQHPHREPRFVEHRDAARRVDTLSLSLPPHVPAVGNGNPPSGRFGARFALQLRHALP